MVVVNSELSKFFSDFPLYSKFDFCEIMENEDDIEVPNYFSGIGYKFYCPIDKDYNTFKFEQHSGTYYLIRKNEVPEQYLDNYGKISLSFLLHSKCQICGFRMAVAINVFSEDQYFENAFINLKLRKIGQLPGFERTPEKDVFNYLIEEDKENYKKALANLSMSYGIGAYAYLRRIIENEIKRLVKDISELEYENVNQVKKAWTEYETNHNMTSLIDSINPFLPKSLKEIGDNPIKILYQQTSGGLHEFSEKECLEKARDIDQLLRYVIKNVSSLKFEYKAVKEAMKNLTK
jgi:hypothetical protein